MTDTSVPGTFWNRAINTSLRLLLNYCDRSGMEMATYIVSCMFQTDVCEVVPLANTGWHVLLQLVYSVSARPMPVLPAFLWQPGLGVFGLQFKRTI